MTSTPIRKTSLASQVEHILIDRIKADTYPPGSKLPTEEMLAEEFDVSRATIRAAFNAMTASQIIVRRHGIGTFVSQAALLSNPLDQSIDFLELISANGFSAGFNELFSRIVIPGEEVLHKLDLEDDRQVLEVHKVFTADGEPVIYSLNYIPEWVFKDSITATQVLSPGATEPFFSFFRDICRCELKYYLSDVYVGMPGDYPLIVDPMRLDSQTPILVIDEIGYDLQDRPVNYAIEYLPGNHMQFSLVRKCLQR
jgi:GntR family transcriptional regulator